jgi:hypothetical protein
VVFGIETDFKLVRLVWFDTQTWILLLTIRSEAYRTINPAGKRTPLCKACSNIVYENHFGLSIVSIQGVIERGLTAIKEKLLELFEGKKKRFIDVAGMDGEEIIELHQVGKQTKDGRPIKRERIVIDEIEKEIGIKPKFHQYN